LIDEMVTSLMFWRIEEAAIEMASPPNKNWTSKGPDFVRLTAFPKYDGGVTFP
jgi:hypothetical protein